MMLGLSLLLLTGFGLGWCCRRIGLPEVPGYLLAGVVLGPQMLNLLGADLLRDSSVLRQIALIIILAKAGLSLDSSVLKRIGRPAALLCFLPATFEILAYVFVAPALLGVSRIEGALMGAVMGAVSPAVVVPAVSRMIDENYGTDKGIPQMIIAGSSADDVYVIVLFYAFLSMAGGESVSAASLLEIPSSIILGVLAGIVSGLFLYRIFRLTNLSGSMRIILVLAFAFLLQAVEELLKGIVSVSGLLAVISMCILLRRKDVSSAEEMCRGLGRLWDGAQIFLFVLVGAEVRISSVLSAGAGMAVMLGIGLLVRSLGTLISVAGTDLSRKEKRFVAIAELPKATVQAAIGSIPLSLGLGCGDQVLTLSVLSILITAPIGSVLINATYRKLCNHGIPESEGNPSQPCFENE